MIEPLSRRQYQILLLALCGYDRPGMAKRLGLGARSIEHHRARLWDKVADNRQRGRFIVLVRYAVRHGLIDLQSWLVSNDSLEAKITALEVDDSAPRANRLQGPLHASDQLPLHVEKYDSSSLDKKTQTGAFSVPVNSEQ